MTLRIEADPRGPVCRIRRPMVVSSGRMRSNVERSQPAKIGDIAGVGAVAAAGDRAVDRLAAERDDLLPEPADLGFVGGRHLHPDLCGARRREQSVIGFQHLGRRGWAWEGR